MGSAAVYFQSSRLTNWSCKRFLKIYPYIWRIVLTRMTYYDIPLSIYDTLKWNCKLEVGISPFTSASIFPHGLQSTKKKTTCFEKKKDKKEFYVFFCITLGQARLYYNRAPCLVEQKITPRFNLLFMKKGWSFNSQ